ncbi:MAG: response regulator [Methanomicrobiaceae archaeon]|nr:response regulator [Methanomicrobiaceae archaeon]
MNKKILIVEDSALVALEISETLKSLGYNVVGEAASGAEAIEMARDLKPDLVLMDIILKGDMDGIEAADRIYSSYDIPVIYLTAHSDEATLERALKTNAFGYLIKPFNDRELYSNIEITLHKHRIMKKVDTGPKEAVDSTLNFVSEPVVATDEKGIVTRINSAAEVFGGRTRDEVIGNSFFDIFCLDREKLQSAMDSLKKDVFEKRALLSWVDDLMLVTKSGEKKEISMNVGYVRPGRWNPAEFFFVFIPSGDVPVKTEGDVAGHYRIILDAVENPVFMIDSGIHIVLFNRAFGELCEKAGISPNKSEGPAFSFLPHSVFGGEYDFEETFQSGTGYVRERSWKTDNELRTYRIETIPLYENGRIAYAAIIMSDITRFIEFEERNEKLAISLRAYTRNVEEIGDLCAGLKEPLNMIKKHASKISPSFESMQISALLSEISEQLYSIDMKWLEYERIKKYVESAGGFDNLSDTDSGTGGEIGGNNVE